MTRSRAWLILLGALAITGVGFFLWYQPAEAPSDGMSLHPTKEITIGDTSVRVAIADTEASREQGLSGVAGLAPDEGMLFIFEEDSIYPFWMKDMLFSIDMLWIAADGRVVSIARRAAPESFPGVFTPDTPARYVLEVAAGFATQHGIEVGSKAAF